MGNVTGVTVALASFILGIFVWMLKLAHQQGQDRTKITTLWELHMEGAKQHLKAKGLLNQNSPYTLREYGEIMQSHGGPEWSLKPVFESMVKSRLPKHDDDLAVLVTKRFGVETLSRLAQRREITMMDQVMLVVMALRKAKKDGMDSLMSELGPME